MTDLCPLPKPAPHGDILLFIFEKDGGMTGEETRGRKQKTGRDQEVKREDSNDETGGG